MAIDIFLSASGAVIGRASIDEVADDDGEGERGNRSETFDFDHSQREPLIIPESTLSWVYPSGFIVISPFPLML